MLIFASLCLLCWVQVKGMMAEKKIALDLDFNEESIDDMFFMCKKEMETLDLTKYKDELKKEEYGDPWKKDDEKILTQDEMQAIRLYTQNKNEVYKEFNNAVRIGKNVYGTSFKFHILYFLLTSAVQKLKTHDKIKCYTTYRRNQNEFNVKEKIRFGSFASSSLKSDQTAYGNTNCFKIKTCYGAKIKEYSAYPDEEEVLIPPYEVFTVKKDQEVAELKDCSTTFVLKSHGICSHLNCKLLP